MFKRFIIAGIIATMMIMFTACGSKDSNELWTYNQAFEVNDNGEITYSVHTFYSGDREYARKMASNYQDYYLDKGKAVTSVFEINDFNGETYYQFKVAE